MDRVEQRPARELINNKLDRPIVEVAIGWVTRAFGKWGDLPVQE
jgi:hypothetical protein